MDIKLLNGRCLHGTIVAPYSYYLSLFSTSDKSEKQEQFMISMIDLVINNSVCNTLSFLCFLISPVKTNVLAQKLQVRLWSWWGRLVIAVWIICGSIQHTTAATWKGFINIFPVKWEELIDILNPFPLSTKVGVLCPNFKLR